MSLSINCPTTDQTIQPSLPVYTIAESDLINKRNQENAISPQLGQDAIYQNFRSLVISSEREFQSFADRVDKEYIQNLDVSLPRSY